MDKKKLYWSLISVVIAILTVWAILSQSKNASPAVIWKFVQESNKVWMFGSLVAMFGFIWFEGRAIRSLAKGLGYQCSIAQGTLYGAADVYFSAITPSASGGQPASAYFMLKDNMPAPVVTVILLINLVMYTLALLSLGLISLLTHFKVVLEFTLFSKIMILIGIVVLMSLGISFYLLLIKPLIMRKLCDWFMKTMSKFRLVKYNQKRRAKLEKTMDDYAECSRVLTGKKKMLTKVFFYNVMQRLSQFAVSFTVFMATGAGLAKSVGIMFIQCFVSLGSNSVPIPGSMGVADYIMLDGFHIAVGEQQFANLELLCRGISFYGCIFTGLLIVIVGYIVRRFKKEATC